VVSCSDGCCVCFRPRPSRDVGSESVLNGDETEECLHFPPVPKSSATDAMACVSIIFFVLLHDQRLVIFLRNSSLCDSGRSENTYLALIS